MQHISNSSEYVEGINGPLYSLSGPKFENCDFIFRYIRWSDRSGGWLNCDMQHCIFYDSQFHDMYFRGCNLTGSKYLECQVDNALGSVGWMDCKLDNAKFRFIEGNNYDNVIFINNSMKGTDMRTSDFSKNVVTFKNCKTDENTKFAGMKIKELKSDNEFRKEFIHKGGIVNNMNIIETTYSIMGRFRDVITPTEKKTNIWEKVKKVFDN